MPGLGDLAENAVLNAVFRGVPYPYIGGTMLSLHSADPGDTGLFEITGLSYTRKACTWNAPSSGGCALAGDVLFLGLPAGTYVFIGVWTPDNVFIASGTIPAQTLNNNDAITINAGTVVTV